MSDRSVALDALRTFLTDPADAHAEELRPHMASDVVVAVHTTNETGCDASITAFQQSLFHNVVFGGTWEEPSTEGDVTKQVLTMPAKGIAAGCRFTFTFNEHDELGRIEGEWILPPAQLELEPVVLTTAMRTRINSADEEQLPVLFAYVTPEGRPEQMYRSGTHTYADDRLAFWNPRPDGSFLASIAVNPVVNAIYRHTDTHEMLEMVGRARVVTDAEEAQRIYDSGPEDARNVDSARTGVAVVIELDRVTGLIHAADTGAIERILMARG